VHLALTPQVAPDETDVGEAHLDERLSRAEVRDDGAIDAAIRLSPTENWNVDHVGLVEACRQ
jgi:hypothetical protein